MHVNRAQAAGVTVLNEIGLDPGIDHLMAMKMVDEVHAQGGKVRGCLKMRVLNHRL